MGLLNATGFILGMKVPFSPHVSLSPFIMQLCIITIKLLNIFEKCFSFLEGFLNICIHRSPVSKSYEIDRVIYSCKIKDWLFSFSTIFCRNRPFDLKVLL